MNVIMFSLQVADFDKWVPVFTEHEPMRRSFGLSNERVFHTADEPNQVNILMNVSDMEKAIAFTQSEDLKQVMQKSGVLGAPTLTVLGTEHAWTQSAAG